MVPKLQKRIAKVLLNKSQFYILLHNPNFKSESLPLRKSVTSRKYGNLWFEAPDVCVRAHTHNMNEIKCYQGMLSSKYFEVCIRGRAPKGVFSFMKTHV